MVGNLSKRKGMDSSLSNDDVERIQNKLFERYDIIVPKKISELENDKGYLTEHQDISGKVDKVEGKELSTNDFTDEEKEKLAGLNNTEIVDNLITPDPNKALSANQGMELFNTIGGINASLQNEIIENSKNKVDKVDGMGLSEILEVIYYSYNPGTGADESTLDIIYQGGTSGMSVVFYNKEQIDKKFANMKRASNLTSDEADIVLYNNFLIICETPLTSLNITMPNTIPEIYNCEFTFTSGETATNLNYSSTPIIWRGDDCDDESAFIPEPNTTYEVSVKNLGASGIVARVGKI